MTIAQKIARGLAESFQRREGRFSKSPVLSSGDMQAPTDTPFILAELHAAHSEAVHGDGPFQAIVTPQAAAEENTQPIYLPLANGLHARVIVHIAAEPLPTPFERPEIRPPYMREIEEVAKGLLARSWSFTPHGTPFEHE